jgi:hypothetical protein
VSFGCVADCQNPHYIDAQLLRCAVTGGRSRLRLRMCSTSTMRPLRYWSVTPTLARLISILSFSSALSCLISLVRVFFFFFFRPRRRIPSPTPHDEEDPTYNVKYCVCVCVKITGQLGAHLLLDLCVPGFVDPRQMGAPGHYDCHSAAHHGRVRNPAHRLSRGCTN